MRGQRSDLSPQHRPHDPEELRRELGSAVSADALRHAEDVQSVLLVQFPRALGRDLLPRLLYLEVLDVRGCGGKRFLQPAAANKNAVAAAIRYLMDTRVLLTTAVGCGDIERGDLAQALG